MFLQTNKQKILATRPFILYTYDVNKGEKSNNKAKTWAISIITNIAVNK